MARTSRKQNTLAPVEVEGIHLEPKKFRTAVYARISLEDKEQSESTSLETQVYMLEKFVQERPSLQHFHTYIDNGFSGTNFERPEFTRMITDMKQGKIECIVVKDVSRLGRNYLEAGAYLEDIFPLFHIRFLSVNDNYDSLDVLCEKDGLSLPLKNLINEAYSKDLSRKLGSAFQMKQRKGEYIGAHAPYGYRKSPESKNKLILDTETAPVVHRIFAMKTEGLSDLKIARTLNEDGIPSPFKYRYEKGLVKSEKYANLLWKPITIAQMLKNQMYLGHMVQGKYKQSLYQNEKQKLLPKEAWLIVEHTHEAIVEPELFAQVEEILKKRKEKYNKQLGPQKESVENILAKIAVCGDCQHYLQITRSNNPSGTKYYYRCASYMDNKERACIRKSMRKEMLEQVVFESIRSQITLFLDAASMIKRWNQSEAGTQQRQNLEVKIAEAKRKLSRLSTLAGCLYEDYTEQLLTEEEYLFTKNKYKEDTEQIQSKLEECYLMQKQVSVHYAKEHQWSDLIDKYTGATELTSEMARAFLKRVEVFDKGKVVIHYQYQDAFESFLRYGKEREQEAMKCKITKR